MNLNCVAYMYTNVATGDKSLSMDQIEMEGLLKNGVATDVIFLCDAKGYEQAYEFVCRVLDPDDLGYSCLPYVRDEARKVLGIEPCETKQKTKDDGYNLFSIDLMQRMCPTLPLAGSFREIPSELDYHQAACFSDPEAQQSGFYVPKVKQGFGITSWYNRLTSAARIMFNKLLQHFN